MRLFVLVSKVLPVILVLCHLLNCIFGYIGWNNVILGYISGISILTIGYLYLVSYLINLCGYYRMSLHYCVIIDIINIYDYYIGISITDIELFFLFIMIRITNLKDYYELLSVNGNIVKIAFDYEQLFDTNEDGNKIESNVGTWSEHVFKKNHL